MAVKRRFQGYSGIRIDIPHLRAIESSVSYDFDSALRGVITGSTALLLQGFDMQIPSSGINANALQVNVSGSAVLPSGKILYCSFISSSIILL